MLRTSADLASGIRTPFAYLPTVPQYVLYLPSLFSLHREQQLGPCTLAARSDGLVIAHLPKRSRHHYLMSCTR
jgi:hypothetical protein